MHEKVAGLSPGSPSSARGPLMPSPPGKSRARLALLSVFVIAAAAALFVFLPRAPAYNVTFFLASDTHYGQSATVAAANERTIDAMNALPGTAYPKDIGGIVALPRGVAVLGDLVNSVAGPRSPEFWGQFTADFGVNGEGRLRFPVYECAGNHDGGENELVRQGIRLRNAVRPGVKSVSASGINYSWDWDVVHFVSLGLFAGADGDVIPDFWGRKNEGPWRLPGHSLEFLEDDLARNVGRSGRPVVLLQHYGWDLWGLSSWSDREREALAAAIKEYNVIAIFWGHTHTVQRVDVGEIPTFCVGSTQADPKPGVFIVARIRPRETIVAAWKTDPGEWGEVFKVARGPAPRAIRTSARRPGPSPRP
jgi:cytolysin (calcineurin-like family phosphatase)